MRILQFLEVFQEALRFHLLPQKIMQKFWQRTVHRAVRRHPVRGRRRRRRLLRAGARGGRRRLLAGVGAASTATT